MKKENHQDKNALPREAGFKDFGLSEPILKALDDVGYESPTPIQEQMIPHVLAGRDLVGQAQTGTGKTAAVALPLLCRLKIKLKAPQILVLTPTRELAIQVAEAFQRYAAHLPGFHVVPIYGGQAYGGQLRQLSRGVQVVVGTPGRLIDHLKKGTLELDHLTCMVVDEADEMLRMGFIEDVEWIIGKTPAGRQIVLLSATMPGTIQRIARRYLQNPVEIKIKMSTMTAATIHHRYCEVAGAHKLDALTRLLESEKFDGMIVFVRTRTEAVTLAEKLAARGYAATALNGDIPQNERERRVDSLKAGQLDILVATDVAARGLDVERISHVVNYDIPYDPESYVHRVGRTGRAGRPGEAVLLVTPRERRLLVTIEKATGQKIERMKLPSDQTVNARRIERFKERISEALLEGINPLYQQLIEGFLQEQGAPAIDVAAALAQLFQGDEPLLIEKPLPAADRKTRSGPREKQHTQERGKGKGRPRSGMECYRLEVGHLHKVKPGNIVGAIANEAGIDGEFIGNIDIHDDYTLIDLPAGMPDEILRHLKKVWVAGRRINISRGSETAAPGRGKNSRKGAAARKGKSPGMRSKRSYRKHQ